METYKLKLKIGENEFEAEGPGDVVQAQFEAFRELVAMQHATPKTLTPTPEQTPNVTTLPPTTPQNGTELMLGRIMRVEGRVVSLTARGATLEDEILLVLLGQRNLRENESVSGGEILDGLRLTGRQVNRIDYQLDKMTTAGDVITIGTGRARRYRLTNQGFAKAQDLSMDLVSTIA